MNTHPEQWRPESSWGFGVLLKGTSVVVLTVEESAEHLLPPPTNPTGPETRTRNLRVISPTPYPLGHNCVLVYESTHYATIYSDILNVSQKTGYRFNSFEILMLNVTLSDKQNKCLLSLALATVYRPPGPYTDFLKEFSDTHLFSQVFI